MDAPTANCANCFQKKRLHSGEAEGPVEAKTLPLLLPDIAASPESPCLTSVNMVASILRDALPVKGLELSQDDSDLDEGNISGDELEQCDFSAGEGMFEA
jgi:hypothetical protein